MTSFDFLWLMLDKHGVIERYKSDCYDKWVTFTLEQQRQIYRSIRDKLQAGKFVNYNPVKAVRDNAPKAPKPQTLSFADYYARFGTTEPQNGWHMENPTGNQVIYTKVETT